MNTQKTTNYFIKQPANQQFQYKEFTTLNHPKCMLPGKWETLEVETSARVQRTSFAMATKLHPDGKDYIDFIRNHCRK